MQRSLKKIGKEADKTSDKVGGIVIPSLRRGSTSKRTGSNFEALIEIGNQDTASIGDEESTEAMRNASRMMDRIDRQMEDMNNTGRDLGRTFQSAFEDAVVEGENLRSVLKGLLDDIVRITVRKNASEPLGDAVAGFDWGSLFSGGGGGSTAVGTGSSPAMASSADGNLFTSPSATTIAERGQPEAVLPLERQGGKLGVRASGGGGGDVYNIDARGADQAAIARLERTIQAMNGSIERRAVAAVGSQRQRSFRG